MGDMEIERAVSFNVMISPTLPAAMQSIPVATWHLRNIWGEKYSSTYTHSSKYHCPYSYEFSAVLTMLHDTADKSSQSETNNNPACQIYNALCKRIKINFQFESQMKSCKRHIFTDWHNVILIHVLNLNNQIDFNPVVNGDQQDATILAYLFIPNQLYTFRAMSSPIIRSTWQYLYSFWYFPPILLLDVVMDEMEHQFHLIHDISQQHYRWKISEAVNTVKCSWWWTKKHRPKYLELIRNK